MSVAALSGLLVVVAASVAAEGVVADGAALDFVTAANERVAVIVEATSVAGDSVVAVSAVATWVDFDPLLAGSTGFAESAVSLGFGCVPTVLGAVAVPDSVVLVCAPPLLLTVTPDPTWVDEDVVPDVFESVAVVVDPELVDTELLPVDVAVEVPVLGVAADELESVLVAELPCDVDEVLEVSALARPGELTTITPIPKAAASAPTRPI